MTFKFNKVYIGDAAVVVGPYEKQGPLKVYFDKCYDDLYNGEKTFEKAESRLLEESIDILLAKTHLDYKDINLIIAGDLLNQITSSCYGVEKYNVPFLGVYGACSTSVEALNIGASFINSHLIDNCITSVSSHNMSSEKQFRNPTEYGAPKPDSATFTATGGASLLLTSNKTNIKVESSTIGRVIDMGIKDPFNMGAVMAPAAGETIFDHLMDTNRNIDYYDLILTGDLGVIGKKILKDYLKEFHNIVINDNYNDCGTMLYDLNKQKEVKSGGSGPACSAIVNYTYVLDEMKKGKLKRVLLVATGALFSPVSVYQKNSILAIAHAVSLEAL